MKSRTQAPSQVALESLRMVFAPCVRAASPNSTQKDKFTLRVSYLTWLHNGRAWGFEKFREALKRHHQGCCRSSPATRIAHSGAVPHVSRESSRGVSDGIGGRRTGRVCGRRCSRRRRPLRERR